jgi:putative ABC transport system permease protein
VNALRLAWAYLAARPLLSALHVLTIAIGVATMALLLLFTAQTEDRLAADARPVDLVVGAKGSPMQLILSSVLHVDVPTGNIPYAEARKVAAHPMVAAAIPLALGDSFRGFRIVGTEHAYLQLYDARLASGRLFAASMEAVVGAQVARSAALAPGASIVGSHGLAAGGAGPLHEAEPYRVVGILAPTGTVLDRLVLTSVESVWHVHEAHHDESEDEDEDEHSDRDDEEAKREITSLLLKFRTPIAAATLPREINATTVMQAASPAYESARLMNMIGVGVDTLRLFAIVLMLTAALSIFVALTSALQERRYDLALLRTLGARPGHLFALVAAEGVTLVVAGVILGFVLGHAAAEALGRWIARTHAWTITGLAWEPAEAGVAIAVLVAGLATCLIPAFQAYRRDPAILLKR